ncbi:alpha-galactosidase [Lactiplantibacillus modestisalitolerans]|uniref:Alpha-galactosidase n=1 Tax=Lactiplantibacillus modestisalitolerans TaxID=1457219 RepID=A0ABV5WS54_9LACO|nr:alpha-galactosidase [Lactiplantibacillus modestisalitolerans]
MTTNLIEFDEAQRTFHLHNDEISYVLGIEEGGFLAHLYYGKRIRQYHGQLKNPRRDRGFSDNLPGATERDYSLDFLLQEYSSAGDGDFRTPATIIRQADGTRSAFFTYDHHSIEWGKPRLAGLPAAYVEKDAEAQTLKVSLTDAPSKLELILKYTIYRDRNVVARSVELVNHGDQAVNIEKIASMQLDLPAEPKEVLSFPGAHANERHLEREPIGFGVKSFGSRRGTTSHQMNNFIAVCDPETTEFQGRVYGISLVYSGNHQELLEKDQFGAVRVLAGINDDQFDWELDPSDHFQTPEVLLTYSDAGLNGMSKTLHSLLRDRVARGKFKHQPRPILVNNWEATFWDFNEEKLRPIVDEAKNLGLEMFVLDDGWFGHRDRDDSSLGDWYIDQKKFPAGLDHFSQYVHDQGLQFGLWVEPEMISIDSDLYRNHPDYMLKVPGRQPSVSRQQYVLDLGRPEVRENVHQQLRAVLDKCQIEYIKWDMNRHITDVYSAALPAERQGEVLHRYVLGLYQLLEELTTEYPDILWEGCSGGGGRFDTGLLYYMPQSWVSDNTDAIARLQIQYGTSVAYPMSSMEAHVSVSPNQQTGRKTSFETRGHVAMSGVLGYELDLTQMTDAEKAAVKNQVAFYKQIRQTVQYGTFIRLVRTANRYAWLFVNEAQTDVVVFSFKILSEAQPEFKLLKLAGLDPDRVYQNVETGAVIGGDELVNTGFYEDLVAKDFSSHVYHFKAVGE